ncbi:MAG: ParB/RepB/Spo0J family partition protein [Epsilonproteobacteria bacterium]|nr:MAG: ParB/RepB/Spo0J family partition protein [Campylobacterota bacterium]
MALGRGLGEILTEVEEAYEKDLRDIDSFELEAKGAKLDELPLESISANPFQPRKHFDQEALKELSESIMEHGLLQPIVVIEKEDGYLLIAGERRLRAHKLANRTHIKAIIASADIDEIKLRELALIENIQRENLNAIELANSYAELIDVHNITHDELSSVVHKSRSQITNTMRLLSLSPYAQKQLVAGKISQGHAKVLVGLDEKKQKIVIDSVIGQKLSVRDTEKMIKNYKENSTPNPPKQATPSLLKKYEDIFKEVLPFKHTFKAKSIEISFENEKEVEAFLEQFQTMNDTKINTLLKRILK